MTDKAPREHYPICPICWRPMAVAMMTSKAVRHEGEWYYHPNAVSVYCTSGACNHDMPSASLKSPPPPPPDLADYTVTDCSAKSKARWDSVLRSIRR